MREQAALAKLGEMAAVVAHEVKNPLAGIRGVMQVFEKRLTHDATATQIVKDIVSRIDSLDQMMKDLLLFARPPKPRRALTDVAPLVSTTARLLSEDPMWQEVDVVVDGAVPPVQADPEMLKIVFQNLLINGAHAMHGKGRIHVAIDEVNTMCQIAFRDGGPGIPDDVRDKVFTPFFTTKSRGSGLGLPTAKRFVEAHDGQIAIDCPPGGGTTVVVRIPMSAS
jgi:signal transduction histidine kinase